MRSWLAIYCLLAGACDASTGILLLAAPRQVSALLHLEPVPLPVYASFIGVFVLGVGLAYLYPFLLGASGREQRLGVVLETTAISRLGVAIFLGTAMAQGRLGLAWSIVMATDLSLGLFQLAWRRRMGRMP